MRIVFVALAILCVALAPCVLGRSLTSTDSSLVDRFNEDETLLHVQEVNRESSEPGRSLEWRSLKASGSKSKGKKKLSKGELAAVVTICIVVSILLLLCVYIVVTEKREKDPNSHVHTFFQRKLKHQYTIKGIQARQTKANRFDEKPDHVERKAPAAYAATPPT